MSRHIWRTWGLACILLGAAGCAGVGASRARLRVALEDRRERIGARALSGSTGAVLARHGLVEAAANDPAGTAGVLETRLLAEGQGEPDGPLALAELSYQAGLERERRAPASALAWYRDAAVLAALALEEPAGSRPDLAVRFHNQALERLVRLSQERTVRDGLPWRQVVAEQGLSLGSSAAYLDPLRIADMSVASDLRVSGMAHVYRSDGLGVPLVAHRLADPTRSTDPADEFLPRDSRTGATALVVPSGGFAAAEWRKQPATLLLLDPFRERTLPRGGRALPLAGDRTTPLAVQVAQSNLPSLEWTGLFESEFRRPGVETGLYMLRPYEPGKIPVVLVHGLISSPRAWVQTVNELANSPQIAARYQFWVFLYPTGLPIPASASRLRNSLLKARETLDPGHADRALDQMVVIGHSLGGLLTKMMVQDSGLALWDATIRVPYDQLKAPPELRARIDQVLVFRPLPFVRRVVFIASPHRGSPIANDLFGRVVASFVRRPTEMAKAALELEALNGPDVMAGELQGRAPNAIGNLRTDSPVLAALNRVPISPEVPFHSIIPMIGGFTGTDGVVEYRSSHLDGATSELVVDGTHFSQQRPEVTRELRRILLDHAALAGLD